MNKATEKKISEIHHPAKFRVGDKVSVPVRFNETGVVKELKDGRYGVEFQNLPFALWYNENELRPQVGQGLSWAIAQEISTHENQLRGGSRKGEDWESGFCAGMRHILDNIVPLVGAGNRSNSATESKELTAPVVRRFVRLVVCAAIRCQATGQIVAGARHWDSVMRGVILKNGKRPKVWWNAEQGFIDQRGKFLTRKQAWKIAEKNGQIRNHHTGTQGILFSEDLY